jgi:hypothetical protein
MYRNAFFSFLQSKVFHLPMRRDIEQATCLIFPFSRKKPCKATSIDIQNLIPLKLSQ